MPRVVIPFPLRKYADDQREVIIDAKTLKETMDRLFQLYPEFDTIDTINEGSGILSVCINSKLISTGSDEWDQLSLDEDDEITLIIPIAGG